MFKTILASAALIATTAAITAPAQAGARWLNGLTLNGIEMNGKSTNGGALETGGFAIDGIELPAGLR